MHREQSRFGLPEDALARVRAQARRLAVDDEFVTTFYDVLFTTRPELRDLFPADLVTQRSRFSEEFTALVQALDDPEGFERRGRKLGGRHAGYGVRTEHYAMVRDVLVVALAAHLGEDLTDRDRDAWATAYDLISAVLQKGAADAG